MLSTSTHPNQGPPEGPQFAEAVLNHAGLFIVVVDRQGRIVRLNPACEKISGLEFGRVRGRLVWEVVQPSDIQTVIQETITRLVQEEQPFFQFTHAWEIPDAPRCWVSWTITAIPDAGGRPEYLIAVGQDVTKAHNLQQQAAETQALNEKILSEAPIGMGVYRADGQCVLVNETAAHIAHVSSEQLLQQNFRQLESWMHTGLLQAANAALAGQPTQTVEIHTATTFGSEVWLSCRLSCFRLGEQPHLLLLTEDLIEWRQAEARLNLTESRYRTLVEQIPAVTYIAAMDEHTSSIYYSPQVEAMLGYTPEEMVSQPDLWMQMIHPDDRERVYAEISHGLTSGLNMPFQAEYRLFRKDGRPVWVKDTARFVKNEAGSVQYQQGIIFDITEAKQASENMQREAARQAALNEFSQALAEAGVDMTQVLERLTVKATELIGDRAILSLVSEDRRTLEPAVVFDLNPVSRQVLQATFGKSSLPLDDQAIGQGILTGQPLLVPDFKPEDETALFSGGVLASLNQVPVHSLMAVALRAAGQVIGVLCLTRETPGRSYTPEDLAFLQQLADRAALAVANARLYTHSQRQNQELERRVAERTVALQQSEQTLRDLLNAFPESTFLIRLDGTILNANRVFTERIGRTPEQIIGRNIAEFLPPELAASRQELSFNVLMSGQSVEFEDTQEDSIIHNRISPVFGPDGQIVSLAIYALDITARKLAERELYNSRQMLRLVMDTIPQRVFWKDLDLRYIGCNLPCAQDAGFDSPAGLIGKLDSDLPWRTDAEMFRSSDRQVIESGLQKLNYEENQVKPDGSVMWVRVSKTPLRDPAGQIIGILGVYEDITDLKRARDLLEERTRDLARSNADLEQFAYIASHDLQEPLRMISSFTQLLERRYQGKLDQSADEFIHFIVDGTQRMQRLINDLLIYSRVGTRGKPFTPVSTEDLLAQVTDNLQISIQETGAQITHDLLPTISVDQTQFSQLLQNLIGNAIKFHSGEPPRVHLSAQRQGNEWVFSVRDNGIGIDAQHNERIFILFQRLHLHEEYPGTGIGLAVCKKIVERHGGHIWVESAPGQGSTFYFSIPEPQPTDGSMGVR
jgi:PAS domain S-box-containing protein